MKQIGAAYVPYLESKMDYWERQSIKLFGREVKQILLLHANFINSDYFDDIAKMLRKRGYGFVTLEEALKDEAYKLPDNFVKRAGISWLDKWNRAKQLSPPVPQDLFERLSEADDYDWDSLRASLVDKVGLQLACPPLQSPFKKSKASGNKRDLVSALLSTATPIAIWTRCPVSEPTFVSAIDELFNAGALSQLPEYVRKKRLEAMQQQGDHIGQHLVLLWEDPERLPPDGEAFEFQTAS